MVYLKNKIYTKYYISSFSIMNVDMSPYSQISYFNKGQYTPFHPRILSKVLLLIQHLSNRTVYDKLFQIINQYFLLYLFA